jgi:hypothetical protein
MWLSGMVFGIALACAANARGQMAPGQFPTQEPQAGTPASIPSIDNNQGMKLPPHVMEKQAQGRNAERQRRLVEDTNKLLQLATELKTDVDKTNKDILSVDVVKKAEEIEKLAKSVKERMKG